MPAKKTSRHQTDIETASAVHSGSGDLYIGGSFSPLPTISVNNCNLPNPHPNFIGRQEEIKKVLEALSSRAWVIAIDGMGGVGKTTLALEIAHICKNQKTEIMTPKFTGFIWTSARDKVDFGLEDVIREILYVLSPFEMQSKKLADAEKLSLAIRAMSNEPRLLIIDNFETVKDERLLLFLRDQLPNPSKVIITSRHHIQAGEKVITLGGLEDHSALQLLQHEAERLQIPITSQDIARLKIIAKRAYGIPLVLRWAMEMVYNGQSLEWVLQSLENASADEIFDYVFKTSLSILDEQTLSLFRTMSLLETWSRTDAISAMNPEIPVMEDRLGHLVSLSLVEDNRSLVSENRRYQLPYFAKYLAKKELGNIENRAVFLERLLHYYLASIKRSDPYSEKTKLFLESEILNITTAIAAAVDVEQLLDVCMTLAKVVEPIDSQKSGTLFDLILSPARKTKDKDLAVGLLANIGNPYIVGAVVPPSMFFGRRDLIEQISLNFESRQSGGILLVGHRRIGKTSLLRYIANRNILSNTLFVYNDLQQRGFSGSADNFLLMVARNIERALPKEVAKKTTKISAQLISNKLFFEDYLREVSSLINGRVVIMLDEYEILFKLESELGDLLPYLRSLMGSGELGIIMAGATNPNAFMDINIRESPFLNMFRYISVQYLSKEDSIDLINRPIHGLIQYSKNTIDTIYTLTGGQPYLLQYVCARIVDYCNESKVLDVDVDTVKNIAEGILSKEFYLFDHLWEQLDQSQREIAIISAECFREKEYFSRDDLHKSLRSRKHSLNFEMPLEFKDELHELVELGIFAFSIETKNFTFRIGLFAEWIIRKDRRSLRDK